MLLGAMNNPHNDLVKEVAWIVKRFDFLDLTLEMPKAHPRIIKIRELKDAINKPVIGHTAPYLPIGAPSREERMHAVAEFEKCLDVFEKVGATKANVHFDGDDPEANIWTLKKLVSLGRSCGIDVMAENTPGMFSGPLVLKKVFDKVPGLFFHLDIAHANIGFRVNQAPLILKYLSKKLAHVHISDNSGRGDEHLGIGRGSINWQRMLAALKLSGYDGTITVEVFTSPKERVSSAAKVRKIWDDL